VSEQQFVSALQPPSASGNTAQDALLALLDQVDQNAPGASTSTASAGGTGTSSGGGNTAQDALAALLQSFDATESKALGSGNSAQDALIALINADGGSTNGANSTSTTGSANSSNLALALSLYQNQLNQQLFGGAFAAQSAGASAA